MKQLGVDGTFRLKDSDGHVRIINFWASWCEPCRNEKPLLQQIHNDYKENIQLIMINYNESDGAITRFLQSKSIDFPVYLKGAEIANLYNVIHVPTTFVINEKRKVLERYEGELNEEIIMKWIDDYTK